MYCLGLIILNYALEINRQKIVLCLKIIYNLNQKSNQGRMMNMNNISELAKELERLTPEELRAELAKAEEDLRDLEDERKFTLATQVHHPGKKLQNFIQESEQEISFLKEKIELIKKLLQ